MSTRSAPTGLSGSTAPRAEMERGGPSAAEIDEFVSAAASLTARDSSIEGAQIGEPLPVWDLKPGATPSTPLSAAFSQAPVAYLVSVDFRSGESMGFELVATSNGFELGPVEHEAHLDYDGYMRAAHILDIDPRSADLRAMRPALGRRGVVLKLSPTSEAGVFYMSRMGGYVAQVASETVSLPVSDYTVYSADGLSTRFWETWGNRPPVP